MVSFIWEKYSLKNCLKVYLWNIFCIYRFGWWEQSGLNPAPLSSGGRAPAASELLPTQAHAEAHQVPIAFERLSWGFKYCLWQGRTGRSPQRTFECGQNCQRQLTQCHHQVCRLIWLLKYKLKIYWSQFWIWFLSLPSACRTSGASKNRDSCCCCTL